MHLDESPQPASLKMPALPDELAATLYEILQDFLVQYEACYFHQIRRHYQACDRERRELQSQMLFERSQYPLPLEDRNDF
jgi:hypothetical protein